MSAPSDDPVAAQKEADELKTKLQRVEEELADLEKKKTKGWDWFEKNAELTHDQLKATFPERHFEVDWEKVNRCDLSTKLGEVLKGPLKVEIAALKKKEESLIALLTETKKDLNKKRDEKEKTPDTSQWEWDEHLNEKMQRMGPYLNATEAVGPILQFILGILYLEADEEREKNRKFATAENPGRDGPQSQIFCYRELMGKGKTRLMNELCGGDIKVVDTLSNVYQVTAKFIRMTYNEQVGIPEKLRGVTPAHFMKQLLWFHGLAEDEAKKVGSLKEGFALIWEKLKMGETDVLIVCVDELMKLGGSKESNEKVGELIRDLAVYQDTTTIFKGADEKGRVLFLFSCVDEVMLDAAEVASGRKPISVPVPKLRLEDLHELLAVRDKASGGKISKARKSPLFELLFHLCAGTPRHVLDGLPDAVDHLGKHETCAKDLFEAITTVLHTSQDRSIVDSANLKTVVPYLLRGESLNDTDKDKLLPKGWLIEKARGEYVLHPSVLRLWVDETKSADNKVATALRNMFGVDLEARENHEKRAEDVLLHFEEARRECYKDQTITLEQYYRSGHWGDCSKMTLGNKPNFKSTRVKVRAGDTAMENISTMRLEDLKGYLWAGSIVYSTNNKERGIEYLVPFHTPKDDNLLVACVQVKFTKKDAVDGNVGGNIFLNPRVEELSKDSSIDCFGVLYSTQHGSASTFERVCSFDQQRLEQWMAEVGPLRLHFEKRSTGKRAVDMNLTKQARSYSTCAWTPCTPPSVGPPPLLQRPRPLSLNTRQWRGIHTLAARRVPPFAGRSVARGAVGGFLSLLARN